MSAILERPNRDVVYLETWFDGVMGLESNIPKILEVLASNWWAIRAGRSRAPGWDGLRSGDAIRKL